MQSEDIRKSFLVFFQSKQHRVCKSDYLVPPSDPSLLFTTAGMVQFKTLWAGAPLDFSRATSVQKCLRAGGKGSDLENVGKTLRHHTFFEMLGNFSFGDYFKEEAIAWAWEYVTEVLKMDPSRIYVTVYKDDDEASAIWKEKIGIEDSRLSRLGERDNFWGPAGEEGACGPCSEMLFDLGEDHSCGRPDCAPGCDCERYLEFWNLVFPQFYQEKDGTRRPLERRGIDTGMGLERLTFLMQKDADSNYGTDLFRPIIEEIERICERHPDEKNRHYYHIIADHIRALTFTISENILPSNEGRGYVLRRILRRALRAGRKIDLNKPFLYRLAPVVAEIMKDRYPELLESREFVSKVIQGEEERFRVTLNNAYNILIQEVEQTEGPVFSGERIFRLYDTYGMPVDLIRDEVEEKGLDFDEQGFQSHMQQQKEKGKKSWKGTGSGISGLFADIAGKSGATVFVGYDHMEDKSNILAIVKNDQIIENAKENEIVEFVLDKTPFYAESGGQVGDTGKIIGKNGEAKIIDTCKDNSGIYVHKAEIIQGLLSAGEEVCSQVDKKRKGEITKHHTATHLLQAALRNVLGHHVKQSGSYVGSDRLRFDFSHFKALSREELKEVEEDVNDRINEAAPVSIYHTDYEQAVQNGVTAIFGEKYGDNVRVIDIDGKSRELCGGNHVSNTAVIGSFKIISESSVSAGVRRIEAVCGRSLYEHYASTDRAMRSLLSLLKTSESEVVTRVEKILEKSKSLEKQLSRGTGRKTGNKPAEEKEEKVNDITLLFRNYSGIPLGHLRGFSDELREQKKRSVFFLTATDENNKTSLILSCTKDIAGLHCGRILSEIAKKYGGGGGGRPDMAQAGASQKVDSCFVLETLKEAVKNLTP